MVIDARYGDFYQEWQEALSEIAKLKSGLTAPHD